MNIFTLILTAIIIAIGVTFALLNSEVVHFNYYVGEQMLPLSLLLVFSLIIGVVLGWIVCVPNRIRQRTQIYRLRRQLKQNDGAEVS
ncbi:MAG: LapA family protein [Gammaproteobacteria bacterium]|nr:LapA family protein [Gammaproteobacteria bacterium]